MKFKGYFIFVLFLFTAEIIFGQSRKVINIPDISGYQTLKCDFHMHTVFSDGTVWPTVRVTEAWEEGLDVISITDHIEYLPHSKDIVADHNRSYEIAKPLADEMGILLVKGAEITRSMPPGHLNVLFINNANLLERDDVKDALKEARDQGAFIFWNHPGWKAQQPDTTLWWDEHTELWKNNLIHGIEVFNHEMCIEAFGWAIEKNLTMFGNTDLHGPAKTMEKHRPMTLVFAESRSVGGVKNALFNQRAVVWYNNTLIGAAKYLEPLFFRSLEIEKKSLKLTNESSRSVQIKNNSDIDYDLELVQPGVGFEAPSKLFLKAHHVTILQLNGNSEEVNQMEKLDVYYQVMNMITSPGDNLLITFSFKNN